MVAANAIRIRQAYADRISNSTIDEVTTPNGRGIPLDVLRVIRGRAPASARWGEVTEYYVLEVEGRLTYASITRARGGETIHVFNQTGEPLARGVYPVDDEGSASGDVLWR